VATDEKLFRRVYKGSARPHGSPCLGAAALTALAVLAAAMGGCTVSMPMARSGQDPLSTGSTVAKASTVLSPELGDEDWRRARGALAIALDPQGNGSPVSWDNPETTLKGNFVPVGRPFVQSDEICRAFLATITGQSATSSLQGTACRPSGGEWAIKETKAWQKSV
jgi:surface antigen